MFILQKISNSLIYRYWNLIKHRFPYLWMKHRYKQELHKKLNIKNPKDINEKIQWLQFYTNTSHWSILADKYLVREYVELRIGKEFLVPLIGMWDDVQDIDFDSLPNKFVIKPNNGSYDSLVITDKTSIDIDNIKYRLSYSMNHKFGYDNAEPHYLRIKPCIIAEKLLETTDSHGLIDYKIWCFDGEPFGIFACFDRDPITHHANFMFYDLKWKRHPELMSENFRNDCSCGKPNNLMSMLEIASKLSQGIPQCRVDLYNVNGKIYFGEMTLTSNYGMMQYFTQDCLNLMGDFCQLPKPSVKERISCFIRRYTPKI